MCKAYLQERLPHVDKVFSEYKLIVNTDKTEEKEINASEKELYKQRKQGNIMVLARARTGSQEKNETCSNTI